MYEFTTLGAIVGLVIAIVLIIKKVSPAYSLILGALIGGLSEFHFSSSCQLIIIL